MDLKSILGYSQGSPYAGNPFLDINTPEGLIDMSNTPIDLIGIDNKGNKKKMKAGRKNPYKFDGTIIRETPVAQKGGSLEKYGIKTEVLPDNRGESTQIKKPILTLEQIKAQDERNRIAQLTQNRGEIKPWKKQGVISKAWEIAKHPITAMSYKVKGQDIPENFSKGSTNPYDMALDIINPATYAQAGYNTLGNIFHPLNTTSTLAKAGTNAISNMVDGKNVFNDGSNQEALGMLGDAAMSYQVLNPHVDFSKIPKVIEADPLKRGTYQLRTGKDHPLYNIMKDYISKGEYSEAAKYAGFAAANRLSPIVGKSPIVKGLAEKIMSQSSYADRDISDIMRSVTGHRKGVGSYNGTMGKPTGRNLVKTYLYGKEDGLNPNNLEPIGLEKYIERYGPLKSYDLNIPAEEYAPISNEGVYREDLFRHFNARRDEFGLQGEYNKNSFDEFLKNKINENNGNWSIPSDKLDIYNGQGADNIAGHMNHFRLNEAGQPVVRIQDIWKFTPEDYNVKWDVNRFRNTPDMKESYLTKKQPAMLDVVGKPFILSKELPLIDRINLPALKVNTGKSREGLIDLRWFQKGGTIKSLFNYLFNDDEEKPAEVEKPTSPDTEEIPEKQVQQSPEDDYAMKIAMGEDEDTVVPTSGNPYRTAEYGASMAPKVPTNPYRPGELGQKIIGDLTEALGYTPQFSSVKRSPEKQAELVRQGFGVKNSFHLTGDAVDMKPQDWKNLSSDKQQYFKTNYDVVYHNNHYHVEPKGSPSDYQHSDKAKYAYDFFQKKGLDKHHAAGIVGNLIQESGNFRDDVIAGTKKGDSGLATGIAQWHEERRLQLERWAAENGKNPYTLDAQLEFVYHEAKNRGDLKALSGATTPEEASYIFAKRYERPRVVDSKRINYAKKIYDGK